MRLAVFVLEHETWRGQLMEAVEAEAEDCTVCREMDAERVALGIPSIFD